MAITYPAAYSSVQGDGGNGGLAITTDTTPVTDDILVVCLLANANGDTFTPPGGWTEAIVGDNSIATTGGQIRAWYLADPAASTTYTWTVGTSTRRSIVGQLVRGVDNASIVDVKGSLQNGPGANHTPPSLTSTVANVGVVDFIGLRQFSPDTANFTVPASGLTWTEQKDVQGADSNNNCRLACGTAVAGAAGALSTATWSSADVNEDTIIIRIAFKPAAAGGTVTGTAVAALGASAGTSAGTPTVLGTASKVLASPAATAIGTPTVLGTAAAALPRAVGTAAGLPTVLGAAVKAFAGPAGVAIGLRTVSGAAVAALGRLTGAAGAPVAGVGAGALSGLSGHASGTGVTPAVTTPGGGWSTMLFIMEENRRIVRELQMTPPVACPRDGWPLREGADGELRCAFDGWIWDGTLPAR